MDFDLLCVWLGRALVLYLAYILTRNFLCIWKLYIAPTPVDFSKYGKWSVVTGATAGIGRAMAFELASRGQNVILISRSKEKLDVVAKEIAARHQVETKCLQINFSDDEHIYDEIKEFIQGYDIGVLINNVGISNPPAEFLKIPNLSKTINDIVKVNIISLFKMHQIVLPAMVKKQKGIIINLSSASKIKPLVYLAMYGASKSLIDYFSQALSYEYEEKGIIIQSLSPSFIQSQMTSKAPNYKSFTKPETWVKSAFATIGKQRSVFGDLHHTFQGFVLRNIPIALIHRRVKTGSRKEK